MSAPLRSFLLLVSLLILFYVIGKIRKNAFEISDSVFWFIISVLLILLAIFPEIAIWVSSVLGFESPSNFIFLCGIVILFVRTIAQDQKICTLRKKLTALTQNIALNNAKLREHQASAENSKPRHAG